MAQIGGTKAFGRMRVVRVPGAFRPGRAPSVARAPAPLARIPSLRLAPPPPDLESRIPISRIEDIVNARQTGRLLVQKMGLSGSLMTLVTTAISELARNILLYAQNGEIVLSRLNNSEQLAVAVSAIDQGPGIENLEMVMAGGYSTSGGLGLGLFGLRRIVNHFEIKSQPGEGTQVFVCIWA